MSSLSSLRGARIRALLLLSSLSVGCSSESRSDEPAPLPAELVEAGAPDADAPDADASTRHTHDAATASAQQPALDHGEHVLDASPPGNAESRDAEQPPSSGPSVDGAVLHTSHEPSSPSHAHAEPSDAQVEASPTHEHSHDASVAIPERCDSTWGAIRVSIFAANGCTAATCHSTSARAGELDLASADAYGSLINVAARADLRKPLNRVTPGEQALSLLYLKVSAASTGAALPAGAGAPMPVGRAPLGSEQLNALKLWIRAGAPEHGVVEGTQALLDCAQPLRADPNKSPRPPVPAEADGFQHVAGPWTVAAGSEREVCFATYYDLTDSAPDWARIPCTIGGKEQTCVAYDRRELSQDAQSHHSAISVYAGDVAADDPVWGAWQCAGGELSGTPCDPSELKLSAEQGGGDCGPQGVCQATPRTMTTCTGFGPVNKEVASVHAGGSQAPVSSTRYPEGVYSPLPIKGVVLWNSHGFNLTEQQTTIEQYHSFWYAKPEQRRSVMNAIFTAGDGVPNADVSIMVPPYEQREYCSLYTLPRYARLTELSAHVHKRGTLFRIWLPPHDASCPVGGCTPDASEPAYTSKSYNDPLVQQFDPPLAFDHVEAAQRTLKFCATYDNGKEVPRLLKRRSELVQGAACQGTLYCAGGERAGLACQSDRECGTGRCDACAVGWGFTTEDEMLILLGAFFVPPPG